MPQATTITVNDREATPVAHVFTPAGENTEGSWVFVNKSVEYPAGREKITVRLSTATRAKVRIVLGIPVMATEVINGVSTPKQVRFAEGVVELRFDTLSTTQERKNMVGLLANLLASGQATMNTVLTDLEDLY